MKKLLLLLLASLAMTSIYANGQCTPVHKVSENFSSTSGQTAPQCWEMIPSNNVFSFDGGTASFYGTDRVFILPNTYNNRGTLTFSGKHTSSRFNYGGLNVIVGIYTSAGFTQVGTASYGTKGWHNFSFDFSSHTGSDFGNIAIKTTGNSSTHRLILDNLTYQTQCINSDSAIAKAKDITVKLDKDGIILVNPSQVDNGSIKSCEAPITNLSLDKSLFQCTDLGKQQVVLTANDDNGHTDTETAIITVEPTLAYGTIRHTGIALDSAGSFTPTKAYVVNSSTSTNCSNVVYQFDTTTFDCSKVGQGFHFKTQMIYGNDTATSTTYQRVQDKISPVVTANNIEVTLNETTVIASINANMLVSSATDACGIKEISLSHNSFDCTNLGDNEVTITVTDSSNNVKEVKVNVKVKSYIPNSTLELTTPNSCNDEKATIKVIDSYAKAHYYLKDIKDSAIVGGPVAGTGNDITIESDSIKGKESYYVYAEVADSSKALYLSATGDYLKLNSPGSFDYSKGYTFSTWVRNRWDQSRIWSKPIFFAGSSTASDIEVYVVPNGSKLRILHNRGNNGTEAFVTSTTDMPNNKYFHLAVTYQGAPYNSVKVYVDGAVVYTGSLIAPMKTGTEMSLGYFTNTNYPDAQYSFNGYLDDVRLYDTVRTEKAINEDMNRCLQGTEDNLVLYFPMEKRTGSIIFDKVVNTPAQLGQNGGGLPASLSLTNAISCEFCSAVMDTTIIVGDAEAPDVMSQDITISLDNGIATLTADMINNGSTDNCTDEQELTYSMDLFDAPKALNLSGTNDYLLTTTPTDFNYSSGYTFSAWVKATWTNSSNAFEPIFYAGGSTGSDVEIFVTNTNSRLSIVHNRGNGGSTNSDTRAYLPTDGKYFHLAVTYDGVTSKVYLNGNLQRSTALRTPKKSANSELSFGHLKSSTFLNGQHFNGLLDDIRVYNVARTSTQIMEDMNSCLTGKEENLVAYFPIDATPTQINKVDGLPAQLIGNTANPLSNDISIIERCGGKSFTQVGDYDVTLFIEDNEGNRDSSSVIVTVNDPVGVDENVIKGEHLTVYPNPVSSSFIVDREDVQFISVLDGNGNELLKETTNKVDVSTLLNGLYLIKVQTSEGVYVQKILKH